MDDFYKLSDMAQAGRLRRMALISLKDYRLRIDALKALSYGRNAVFQVRTTDGRSYVLRISRPISGLDMRKQVRSEMTWLSALSHDTDLGVPKPVPTRSGDLSTTVSCEGIREPRECAVMTWLPGRVPGRRLARVTMRRLGELSARLHEHASSFKGATGVRDLDTVFFYGTPKTVMEGMPSSRRRVFNTVARLVQNAMDSLFSDRSQLHLIHNDLHRWNVKVAGDKLFAFDFEWLVRGHPVQDIAATFFYIQRRGDYPALRDSFAEGYTYYREWPEQYPGQLDVLVAGRFLFLLSRAAQDPVFLKQLAKDTVTQERLLREFLDKRRT